MRRWRLVAAFGVVGLLAGCAFDPARRGDRCFERGDLVAAVWHYGRAIDQGTTNPTVPLRRAAAFRLLGDSQAAERELARAARLGSVEAKALLAARRGVADLATARALAEAHADESWAWSLFGDLLLRAGRPDDAATAYQRALALRPDGEFALRVRYNLIAALLRCGRVAEARRQLNSYLEALDRPPDADERYLAGLVAYAEGDYQRTAEHWRHLAPSVRERVRQVVGDEPALAGL